MEKCKCISANLEGIYRGLVVSPFALLEYYYGYLKPKTFRQ